MAIPLHDVEVLVSLAEASPGESQAWGASRLAVIAPERFQQFPSGEGPHEVVLATQPPRCVDALIEAIEGSTPCPTSLAATAATLGVFGVLPSDRAPLVTALRGALRNDGDEADLWLAYALTTLGACRGSDLASAAHADSPDRHWLLPVLVLQVADAAGQVEDAAAEVARSLDAVRSPDALSSILAALGTATGPDFSARRDVAEAVSFGAAQAGRPLPGITQRKGSRKRQIQGAIHHLLEEVQGPSAALLRAVYHNDADLGWGMGPVAIAAWLGAFEPGDPVRDVLHHRGGADPQRLSQARAAIGPEHNEALLSALQTCPDASASVLALARVVDGDAEMAEAVLRQVVSASWYDHRIDALASVAAWHCADLVPDLLRNRHTRDLGLLAAEWTPTEEVLQALLDLSVPADLDPRIQFAQSLAAMGDPAVIPTLAALLNHNESGELDGARFLAESLLNTPL